MSNCSDEKPCEDDNFACIYDEGSTEGYWSCFTVTECLHNIRPTIYNFDLSSTAIVSRTAPTRPTVCLVTFSHGTNH
jgi:hypothetical protein